ncbi:DUF4184 family protein [Thermomonospora cellulosilytica]|uniref:DUF4184 family protein n=1 Tax=Thermomonospora cellulosilytica TaxID=1411118 RepID=A0A7W3MWA7_9ACTN|nr:DUF4184 family protein [Thermomonospora cellulosilytica]MBA9002977.1 hypothetical protein [Thermomonospora cellulosilytica]
MPFTLSHPAIVLPLARGPLVPSALVVGAMAPDLPYFVGMADQRLLTHRLVGVPTVDLGMALLLLVVFHRLLKWPLLALCPAWLRARLAAPARAFDERGMGDLGWVVVSACLGAFTHVAWDAFTHEGAAGVRRLPFLAEPLAFGLPGYRVAQYASGLVGALVIAAWTVWWLRRRAVPADPVPPGLSARSRLGVLAAGAAVSVAGGLFGAFSWMPMSDRTDFHARLVGGVVGLIAFAGLALLAFAMTHRVLNGSAARAEGA